MMTVPTIVIIVAVVIVLLLLIWWKFGVNPLELILNLICIILGRDGGDGFGGGDSGGGGASSDW